MLPTFLLHGRATPLVVRRSSQARRMRLTVDPRDGRVRLGLPTRAALAPALAWVEEKRPWIERLLDRVPPPQGLGDDATLPFRGRRIRIAWRADAPRTPLLAEDRLLVGGPADAVEARVLRWLRGQALGALSEATARFAMQAGVSVARVSVADPRSRWGSCSSSGAIRYSWRLILAPDTVLEATAAHEVAHRLHMDHSPAFHAAVTRLLGRVPDAERAWLRLHGAEIQRVGRL